MTSPIAAIAVFMALLLLALAAWIASRETYRRLRARVQEAADRGRGPIAAADLPTPSIRMAAPSDRLLLQRLLRLLGIDPDLPEERIVPWPLVALMAALVGALVWSIAGFYLGRSLGLSFGLAGGLLAAREIFHWQHRRYCDALFKQVPDALGLVLRAVRSGLPMAEALRSVAREMPAPTGPQFIRIVGETAIGNSIESAFLRLYERTQVTEYGFLSVTLGLQSQSGGSLSETLENLADIVRKRVTIAARARALAAESTSSAVILIILPFACALAMAFIRPGYLSVFWNDPRGFKMLVTGLTLMALGSLTIRWLIRGATAE